MFQELLAWIRPSLLSVKYSALSVMTMTYTLPPGEIYTYMRDSKTPEVHHTTRQRLRVHFRQSHIQASGAF